MQRWLFVLGLSFLVWNYISAYQHPDWAYGGAIGPSSWKKEYPMCAGSHQSPINVDTKKAKYESSLQPFSISLRSKIGNYTVKNLGLNAEIFFGDTVWNAEFAGYSKQEYRLHQIHFHWGSENSQGSEHTIDGKRYPLEAHVVMWNSFLYNDASTASKRVNGLAVLSVLFEIDNRAPTNPIMDIIVAALGNKKIRQCPCTPTYKDIAKLSIEGFDINQLLPRNRNHFYRYQGSLTTPPCTENVMWTIFRETVHITDQQIGVFRNLLNRANNTGGITQMYNNFRPVNPLNPSPTLSYNRVVTASFHKESILHRFMKKCKKLLD